MNISKELIEKIDSYFDNHADYSFDRVLKAGKIFGRKELSLYWNDKRAKWHW